MPIQAYRDGNFTRALTGRNLCPTATPNCDPIGRTIMEGTVYDPSTQRLATTARSFAIRFRTTRSLLA